MIFLLTPSTVTSVSLKRQKGFPYKINRFGLGLRPILPIGSAIYWRFLFEKSFPRYVVALLPFVVAMLIWPDLAFPISQAPVPMFVMIFLLETRVLSVPTEAARAKLIAPDRAAAVLDLLAVRARAILTDLAAEREIMAGALHLVVEQSRMARVAPLSFVSVQHVTDGVTLLELSEAERAALAARLFDAELDERTLRKVNLAENSFLRSVALDPATVSAHARLAAMARRAPTDAPGHAAPAPA